MPVARSYLYVPGSNPGRFDKAVASGADAVIVDLEDAVPVADKQTARDNVRRWLDSTPSAGGTEIWVRVNSGPDRERDVASLSGAVGIAGLVLAKSGTADDVAALAAALDDLGHGDWLLHPLLETPAAVLDARGIARLPSVQRLQIGEYDLCAELGIVPGDDERELDALRSAVVLASAAAGAMPPVAPVSVEIADLPRFRASTERAARQGFLGRACIHPSQLSTVHDVFTPDDAEVRRARRTLQVYQQQVDSGSGVMVDDDGRMLDEAVVRRSRRILELAGERREDS